MARAKLPKWWVVLVALAALGAVVYGFRAFGPKSAPEGAVRAVARVVRSEDYDGTCAVPSRAWSCFQLKMDVYDARENRDVHPRAATVRAVVENRWSSRIQPGSWVAVLVDPASGDVFLDIEAFAVPPPPPIVAPSN